MASSTRPTFRVPTRPTCTACTTLLERARSECRSNSTTSQYTNRKIPTKSEYCDQSCGCFASKLIPTLKTDLNFLCLIATFLSCNGADVLMVYITINGQRKRLDNLCGDELPKQLMSNDNSITLEFKTFHVTEHHRGFSANFTFLTSKFSC